MVCESGHPAAQALGVKVLGHDAVALLLEVGGGSYHFSAAAPPTVMIETHPAFPGKPAGDFTDDLKSPAACWRAISGRWKVEGNQLVARGTGIHAIADKWWTDATYRFRCRVLSHNGEALNWGGLGSASPTRRMTTMIAVIWSSWRANGQLVLYRTGTTMKSVETGLNVSKLQTIRVQTAGDRIRVFLNDETSPASKSATTPSPAATRASRLRVPMSLSRIFR